MDLCQCWEHSISGAGGVTFWTVFLTIFPISLASDSVDFRVVHQTSTDTTLECSYNGKVETYPSIRVNHNGRTIRETANSTKLLFDTATPLCGKEKHFSCVVNYDDKRIPKDVVLLPSHDRPTISTAENKSPCHPTNKMVTVVCLVKNLCIKENVWFVESHHYSLLSQDLFFDEVTSSRGERRYFATAVASMTFHRGGKVNGTCTATSGESTTKAIDVFDCQKNKMDDQQITIITNGLSSFPAEKKVTIWCSVKNLLLKEKILLLGDNFYQHEEATIFYTETTSIAGKKSYLANVAATGTFREEGISNLICSTESGRSATKAITVEKNEEKKTNDVQKVFIHINDRLYANKTTTVTCIAMAMISKEKVWFDGNNFYQPQYPDIIYETSVELGKERYVAIATAQVIFIETGDFNLTCLTARGGYATKPITVLDPIPKIVDQSGLHLSFSTLITIIIVAVVVCLLVGLQWRKKLRCRCFEEIFGSPKLQNQDTDRQQRAPSRQVKATMTDDIDQPGNKNFKNNGQSSVSRPLMQVENEEAEGQNLQNDELDGAESLPLPVTEQQRDPHLMVNGTASPKEDMPREQNEPKNSQVRARESIDSFIDATKPPHNLDIENQASSQELLATSQSPKEDVPHYGRKERDKPILNRLHKSESTDRFWRLASIITNLTSSNIAQSAYKINKILDEGDIHIYQNCLINRLIEKVDYLYEEEAYAQLIKDFYHKANHTDLPGIEEKIWDQFSHIRINNESEVTSCKKKLKIFLELDPSLSSRLLLKFTNSLSTSERNEKLLKVMTFLLEENADPFMVSQDGDTAFTSGPDLGSVRP